MAPYNQATGGVFIAGGGVVGKLLFQRSGAGSEEGRARLDAARSDLILHGFLGKTRSLPAYAATCPLIIVSTSGDELGMAGCSAVASRRLREIATSLPSETGGSTNNAGSSAEPANRPASKRPAGGEPLEPPPPKIQSGSPDEACPGDPFGCSSVRNFPRFKF